VKRSGSSGREAAAEVLRRSIPKERSLIAKLRDVQAPGSIESAYRRFVGRLSDALPLYERLADTVRRGQRDPELVTKFARLAADTRPFATRHGLSKCLADTR
jgi:hypothetical protein